MDKITVISGSEEENWTKAKIVPIFRKTIKQDIFRNVICPLL